MYTDGLANHILLGPFNPLFAGRNYQELCWYLYAEFQIVLIGLHFRVPSQVDANAANIQCNGVDPNGKLFTYRDHVVLNPGADYTIPTTDIVKELVFIAQSLDDIADVERLTEFEFKQSWMKWVQDSDEDSPIGNYHGAVPPRLAVFGT